MRKKPTPKKEVGTWQREETSVADFKISREARRKMVLLRLSVRKYLHINLKQESKNRKSSSTEQPQQQHFLNATFETIVFSALSNCGSVRNGDRERRCRWTHCQYLVYIVEWRNSSKKHN